MKLLIDGVEKEADEHGYVMGRDITGRIVRASYHSVISIFRGKPQNFKVITSGHVYILNYNQDTYKPERPENFEQYLEDK